MLAVLDAGAEEVNDLGESSRSSARPTDLVAGAHRAAGRRHRLRLGRVLVPAVGEVRSTPDGARKVFKLIDALEDCDDVQNVYANFDVSTRSWQGVLPRVLRQRLPALRQG
jgi:transcriptional/translational regulatory protein YebC/TACO1